MTISIEDLKKLPIWVNWQSEERDGKKTKIPYNPKTGGKAQSNNRDTWADFNFAQSKVDNYSGIGFMFADGICGIDIDNKTGNTELDRQAEAIINLMDTYTERSPSGTGWHLIFKCDMSKIPTIDGKLDNRFYYKNPHNDLECYFPGLTNRYFTYTGQGNGKNIEERTKQVLIFIENYMLKDNFKKKNDRQERIETPQAYQTSTDILEKARKSKNGVKFSALYDRGDINGYGSQSEADQSLCNMLAWWLQGDFNGIDSYFRQSALYRDKWERKDYRTNTINKAVDNCGGSYYTPPGRPKTKKEKFKKEYTPEQEELIKNTQDKFGVMDDEKLTIAGVAFHLEQIGVSVMYNETIREAEIKGLDRYNNKYIVDNFPVVLYNDLNLQYKKCTISIVQDFLRVIMMNNAYNPVLELIKGGKWDGIDRLPELFRIMRIDDSDKLSKTLIYKWLWQNLSLARNEKGEYGADGILVLKGEQAAGKTSFARKMALKNEWFGEGLLLDVRQTDTVIRAVSCWIGELGEIESTFKSDINALKAFITLPKDNYRVPYGRIADKLPRRTSFIGTCNSDEYLIDETGNRRYWTVPINERMDLDALEKFDMLQLYLQIDEEAKNNIQGFRLTPEEITQLSERNGQHEKSLKGEQEITDILFKAERDNFTFKEMTVTEFKELYPVLRNYSVKQLGSVLKKYGIILEVKKKDGKTHRLASLPYPKSSYGLD